MQNATERYIVHSNTEEVPGVTTLTLTREDGSVPHFETGQYINVYFPELDTPEGKAYSISSAPHEQVFSITVRAIGEFSNRLCALGRGDSISGSLPYGFFCPESEESDIAMLAAGIGIAPYRSILRDIAFKNPKRRVCLFHSIRTSDDRIFNEELQRLQQQLPNFSLFYFITRETNSTIPSATYRRLEAEDVLSVVSSGSGTEILICGSISFTRDMWKALHRARVSEDHMYTEAFFSH